MSVDTIEIRNNMAMLKAGPPRAVAEAMCDEIDRLRTEVADLTKVKEEDRHLHSEIGRLRQENRELGWAKAEVVDEEVWMREVLADFHIPFDDHKVGRRVALTQWMANSREGWKLLESELATLREQLRPRSIKDERPNVGDRILIYDDVSQLWFAETVIPGANYYRKFRLWLPCPANPPAPDRFEEWVKSEERRCGLNFDPMYRRGARAGWDAAKKDQP